MEESAEGARNYLFTFFLMTIFKSLHQIKQQENLLVRIDFVFYLGLNSLCNN